MDQTSFFQWLGRIGLLLDCLSFWLMLPDIVNTSARVALIRLLQRVTWIESMFIIPLLGDIYEYSSNFFKNIATYVFSLPSLLLLVIRGHFRQLLFTCMFFLIIFSSFLYLTDYLTSLVLAANMSLLLFGRLVDRSMLEDESYKAVKAKNVHIRKSVLRQDTSYFLAFVFSEDIQKASFAWGVVLFFLGALLQLISTF